MKVKLIRKISSNSGDNSMPRIIEKEYEGVAPILGAFLDDPTWEDKHQVKIEKITINIDDPTYYEVEITPRELDSKEFVDQVVEIAKKYGWQPWY